MPDPGSKPPFEDLYREFVTRIYAYVRAQLGGDADAEDVTSQVFIKAYEAYSRFEPAGATPAAWLFRIARNAAFDHLRAAGRRDRLALAIARQAGPEPDPAAAAEARIEHGELLELLGSMPQRQRDVVALRHSGLSFAEVGGVIGCSEDAAKMAYHRALRALRDAARERGLL